MLEISVGLHANYLFVSDFKENWNILTLLNKFPYIRYYGNPLSDCGTVTCGRQV
jgi:hypothetical protein